MAKYLFKSRLDEDEKFIDIDVFSTDPDIYLGSAFVQLGWNNTPNRTIILFDVSDQKHLENEIRKYIFENY